MADDVVETLKLKFEAQLAEDGIHGIERYDYLLEQIEKRNENIEKLKQSTASWAKEEYQVLEKEKEAYEKILELKKEVEEKPSSTFDSFRWNKQVAEWRDKTKDEKLTTVANKAAIKIEEVLGDALESLKKVFKNAWSEFQNIVNQSFLTNATTRSNVMGYGMSLGQSYAFEKAKGIFGISSLEETAYMTGEQQKLFTQAMTNYTERYNKLYDEGFFTKQLEFDMRMQELKDDVSYVLIDFFIENQDTIMEAMEGILTIAKWVLDRFSTGSAADIVNSYSNTKNVKVDMSYNLNGQVDKAGIANAGEQTVMMLVKAIQNS